MPGDEEAKAELRWLAREWRILELANEAAVLANSIGETAVAELSRHVASTAASRIGVSVELLDEMQRDLARDLGKKEAKTLGPRRNFRIVDLH